MEQLFTPFTTSPFSAMARISWALLAILAICAVSADNECGGGKKCSVDKKCVPDSAECQQLATCSGNCVFKNEYASCGGLTPTPTFCSKSTRCDNDPRIDYGCGLACDRPGICLPKKLKTCGGITGQRCRKGLYCYDDPKLSCSYTKGDPDCSGICL